ncbi:MAG: phosphotransferase [Pseudomonadota bacterium]|nr:phosphotransferase [Pseudomonadota bacterium]
MSPRAADIAGFLAAHGWGHAAPTPMVAGLSPRRYTRLERPDLRRAVLMDADAGQNTPAFLAVAQLLREQDIAAPCIYAADAAAGLVLMEDFGDQVIGGLIDKGLQPAALYRRCVDVLVHLHGRFRPASARDLPLPVFNATLFANQAELFLDAYLPYAKARQATPQERGNFRAAWETTLAKIEAVPQSLLLRDFMPDNLMDLPERDLWQSVGVLDFQDAGIGPIAYDLASLCEVVRRDGSDILLDEMIAYYHERAPSAMPVGDLRTACHILAAQRHMRILGRITQYAQTTGRTEKLAWLPRIKTYLKTLFDHKALQPVREWAQAL